MCSVCYDVQAVAPALCDWMIVVEAAGPDWAPAGPKFGQFFLLPAMFRRDYDGLLHTLICTAAIYLDSQEKWKELQATQLGLHDLVRHLGVCMHSTAKALLKKDEEDMTSAMAEVESYFEILSTASKFCCTFASGTGQCLNSDLPQLSHTIMSTQSDGVLFMDLLVVCYIPGVPSSRCIGLMTQEGQTSFNASAERDCQQIIDVAAVCWLFAAIILF